ncbi:hypothetical protein RUM8411_04035 [Ruegeria meonggei]|uniref:Uncharacterized protein n=1 Tax=Ruegeria meonggei TaxID=1446476 RepID=A0A1X7AD05_9RHOB|nr:hypothetical protein RUM8411_04035 [Ruegeria meonggei]
MRRTYFPYDVMKYLTQGVRATNLYALTSQCNLKKITFKHVTQKLGGAHAPPPVILSANGDGFDVFVDERQILFKVFGEHLHQFLGLFVERCLIIPSASRVQQHFGHSGY